MPEDSKDIRTCDIAACRVAAQFYELIPQPDKGAIDQIPAEIADIIRRFLHDDGMLPQLSKEDHNTLGLLHNQKHSDVKSNPEHINILNSLAMPTEALLMHGGDLRLNVDPVALLNQYGCRPFPRPEADRKSTRLNSSHVAISYAVFCLKKKTKSATTAAALT